ncbi:MAG: universal stress protein [Deltaproteobacteria bacterium]|nr:universal stress protein [Deltaproteobacteria bacterium]
MFEKLLYPTDFSDVSKKALAYVKGMQSAGARQVIVLRVISEKKMKCISKGISMAGRDTASFLKDVCEGLIQEASDEMEPVESELKAAGLDVKVRIDCGQPHAKILEIAEEEDVSAIVLGSHGRSNLAEMLLGSVSEYVIRHANKPVLVIKRD